MKKVQIAFLLDATESMQDWIDVCKNEILEIIKKTENVEFEVALVSYTDYEEDGYRAPRVVHFTKDVQVIKTALAGITAKGGDDCAEDVAGGIYCLSKLAWDHSAIQHVVHLADAPPHGDEFHEPWVVDDFPDGDPGGEDLLGMLMAIDGINYTFFKITENTDKFIDILSGVFPAFTLVDLKEKEYIRMGVHTRVGELDDQTFSGILSQIVGETANPSLLDASQSDPK